MKKQLNYTKIRELREKLAWTQEQLADNAGISLRTIQRVENGEPAAFSTIQEISKVLEIEPEDLYVSESSKTAEEKTPEKPDRVVFLERILNANSLLAYAQRSQVCQFSNDNIEKAEDIDTIGNFFDTIRDYGDIHNDLSYTEKLKLEHELSETIDFLSKIGYRVYGGQSNIKYVTKSNDEPMKIDFQTLFLLVVADNNPKIVERNGVDILPLRY